MRTFGKWLMLLVLGLALGAGSAWYMTFRHSQGNVVQNGIWFTNLDVGSAAADPYTRLRIAVTGLFALNARETIYLNAVNDADGQPLTAACDYTLVGPSPKARWWSVTAYGPDDMLINTESRHYAASATSVTTDANGEVQIALTPDGSGPNGIATGTGNFDLTLRLYQPDPAVAAAPDAATLFKIIKGGCRA